MDAIRGDHNYQATPRMILRLLRKGWIEPCGSNDDALKYQITAAGAEAFKAKIPR